MIFGEVQHKRLNFESRALFLFRLNRRLSGYANLSYQRSAVCRYRRSGKTAAVFSCWPSMRESTVAACPIPFGFGSVLKSTEWWTPRLGALSLLPRRAHSLPSGPPRRWRDSCPLR